MSRIAAAVLLILIGGCATHSKKPVQEEDLKTAEAFPVVEPEATVEAEEYEPAFAMALAFDLPVEQFGAPIELSRDNRDTHAFLGFDESVVEYFAVRMDDRQSNDSHRDQYERRAVSVKSGVRYR